MDLLSLSHFLSSSFSLTISAAKIQMLCPVMHREQRICSKPGACQQLLLSAACTSSAMGSAAFPRASLPGDCNSASSPDSVDSGNRDLSFSLSPLTGERICQLHGSLHSFTGAGGLAAPIWAFSLLQGPGLQLCLCMACIRGRFFNDCAHLVLDAATTIARCRVFRSAAGDTRWIEWTNAMQKRSSVENLFAWVMSAT
ncbi:hypothetical protein GQ55_2G148500 [Panicum hallii var. hallii]|uniref:Uncharacterized protein n=1 Tax=Panicum hallii var. hallii TaxID=1504633 RepID=A0A2T7EPS5_9POAL|nr:hypothetical protein GQ55_2G148500 [Panicum hallii var. hallii]